VCLYLDQEHTMAADDPHHPRAGGAPGPAAFAHPPDEAEEVARTLRDLTAQHRLVLENVSDVIVQYDPQGLVLWASPSLRTTFGYDDEVVVGTRLRLSDPDVADAARERLQARMDAGDDLIDHLGPVVCADGTARLATSRTRVVRDEGGSIRYVVATLRDITDQAEAERALSASEAHYRMIAENSADVVLHSRRGGAIDWVSPSAEPILGYRPEDLIGRRVADLMHPDDLERVAGYIRSSLAEGRLTGRLEARFRAADGSWRWMSDSGRAVLDDDGAVLGGIDSLRDVTVEHEMREELARQARRDALTGLPNRRDLLDRLEAVLAHEPRAGTCSAVLFLDLDRLKELNDTYGHALGDAVLVEVGRRITATLRSDDVVGRFAGDEFVVLLPSLRAPADAALVAEEIHRRLVDPVVLEGVAVRASVSIGIGTARPGDRPEDVLRRADEALYRAKATGRSRTEHEDS
jgi:diguanylate cyclase (GGDEF)-like protein/PAS domain S-box-containing protein